MVPYLRTVYFDGTKPLDKIFHYQSVSTGSLVIHMNYENHKSVQGLWGRGCKYKTEGKLKTTQQFSILHSLNRLRKLEIYWTTRKLFVHRGQHRTVDSIPAAEP